MKTQAFDVRVPFTPRQAKAHGISRKELLQPGFHRVLHGIYISDSVPITEQLIAQAILTHLDDDAHLSHHSAAKWWKLWVPDDPGLHVCRALGHRHTRPGVVTHQCAHHATKRSASQVVTNRGIAVTTPVGCFLELARELTLVDLVILGDSLVKRRKITPEKLRKRTAAYRGPGARRAREAAALVRSGVDSPMETRLRLLLVFAGLPEPTVDVRLFDENGELRRRLDLAYEIFKLIVEYDGEQHRETSQAWDADLVRRDELTSERWRSVIVTKLGVYRDPATTVDRVERALRDAGWTGARRPRRDWRQHFPGY